MLQSESPLTSKQQYKINNFDPLLACLLQLTKLMNAPCSETSLIAGLPLVDHRLTPELFVRAAERASLEAKVLKKPLKKIPAITLPAVLILNKNKALLLLEVKDREITIFNPYKGKNQTVSKESLFKEYSGYCIYIKHQQPLQQSQPHEAKRLKDHWFWSVMLSSWRIYRDVLIAAFFINLFAITSPLFVMNVYDRVVPNQALETLWALSIGVIIVYIFDVLLKGLRGYFIEVAGKKSDVLLSSLLFERVLGARYSAKPNSVGTFASQFREFDTIRNFYTSSTVAALVDLPFAAIFLLLIFYIGGALVWVPLAALPIILIYSLALQGPIQHAVEKTFASASQKNSTLIETLVGFETVKVLDAEGSIQRLWERSVGHLATWSQRMRMLSLSVSLFSGFVQQLANVVLIIVGVYLIVEREITMGALIASFMLTGRAIAPLSQVASLLVSYDQTKTALSALDNIVATPQERNPEKPFVKRPSFSGNIEFKQLSFCYPGEKQKALDNVSFQIKAGEKVGIIGRIGSGKSTIQKILLGLYSPTEGSVLFDGIDNQQIDPADLREHIGHVPQDVLLFSGTIKSNIIYGIDHWDDADVIRVAEQSGVKEFVDRHPLGFDRSVGERGQALSGGQRQSIGIARALVKHPSMFIFDEPTSGMDNSTETLIKNQLTDVLRQSTLVLVTHKTSLLALVDRIIVLDNGRLVADGPKTSVLDALKKGQLRVE